MCERCRSHCSRCDAEFTDDNTPTLKRSAMCKSCVEERVYLYNIDNKSKARDIALVRTYGITAVEYEAMLKAQGGVCWICEQPPKENKRRLAVDHLHSKGENKRNPREKRGRCRGLLCWPCNRAIGTFKDDVTKLRRAADYLEAWPAQQILKEGSDE